jgi:hypothetical protein
MSSSRKGSSKATTRETVSGAGAPTAADQAASCRTAAGAACRDASWFRGESIDYVRRELLNGDAASLLGFEQWRRMFLAGARSIPPYQAASAAPTPTLTCWAAVAQFRLLSQLGVAERHVIAVTPDRADAAVPWLQAALAEGPDFDLELTLTEDPLSVGPLRGARGRGSLRRVQTAAARPASTR